jgi:hypothetical protein
MSLALAELDLAGVAAFQMALDPVYQRDSSPLSNKHTHSHLAVCDVLLCQFCFKLIASIEACSLKYNVLAHFEEPLKLLHHCGIHFSFRCSDVCGGKNIICLFTMLYEDQLMAT